MSNSTATYTVQLANTPDGDGDYSAEIACDGLRVKMFYRPTRELALAAARSWVARHRAHDPADVETVTL